MTNKIVILQNSVELYEHYINDEKWEKTLSFPKGGLTYNISNGTIKFFAFEDYLYRNCLMSMQLPIYILDEKDGIDDEYSDIGEIVDILDEIFPTNDIDAELEGYLTKREAELTYQPIGDYVTTYELDEVLDDYYTKDDVYTKQEVDDLLDDKLDASAYTPFDESNYYTKIEVDNKIASADTFDPDQYYNKSQSDTRFALKNEIPSLDGYATEEWVLNKNYVTNSTLQQYINNLQQQINSIVASVSGCCSEPVTIYRWITLTRENDFICSGTTKYEKQQKQQSIDNGMTWTNVVPAEYQRGAVLETDSDDCGYAPDPQYRWYTAPSSDYICSGTTKYYKEYYQVSYDNAQTWQNVSPEQTRRGSVIQTQSTDCGYIAPQYRWYTSQSEYICSGTTKYEKQYYQVSTDGGQHWSNVSPLQTRTGAVKEYNSTDCGYVAPSKLRGVLRNGDTVNINCNSSSILTKDEVGGITTRSYTNVVIGTCVNTINKDAFIGQVYLTDVTLPNTIKTIGEMAFISCTRLSGITFNEGLKTIEGHSFEHCTGLTSVVLPNSVTSIGKSAFNDCRLISATIGSGIQNIGMSAFNNEDDTRRMEYIKILATTPPTISGYALGRGDYPIYVPAASVEAYKSAGGWWDNYIDRIRPIP